MTFATKRGITKRLLLIKALSNISSGSSGTPFISLVRLFVCLNYNPKVSKAAHFFVLNKDLSKVVLEILDSENPVADHGYAPDSQIISRFNAVFRNFWQNRMLVPPGGFAPLLQGILDPLLESYLTRNFIQKIINLHFT